MLRVCVRMRVGVRYVRDVDVCCTVVRVFTVPLFMGILGTVACVRAGVYVYVCVCALWLCTAQSGA